MTNSSRIDTKTHIKLLMQNRDPNLWMGGDSIAISTFSNSLNNLGEKVDNDSSYNIDTSKYDLVMSWNINYPWVLSHLINAKIHNKPFIVFCLSTNVNDIELQKTVIQYSDGLIFLSKEEKNQLSKYLKINISSSKSYFSEIGVNNYYYSNVTQNKSGVLCVGRIEKRKNQLNLVKACIKLNLPLTIVGQVTDKLYFLECCKLSAKHKNINYLQNISDSDLLDLYKKNKVVANIALFEPWGLTVREGQLSNCNVLMTKNTYIKANFPNFWWCDPSDLSSIIGNLNSAYQSPTNTVGRDYINKHYDCNELAKGLIKIYKNVLAKKIIKLNRQDWIKLVTCTNHEIQYLSNRLNTQNKIINELSLSHEVKQKAIEELQYSEINKQKAIEELRNEIESNTTFQKGRLFKIMNFTLDRLKDIKNKL